MANLKLDKKHFQDFLKGLEYIDDKTILHIEEDNMYAISMTDDKSLFLYSTWSETFNMTKVLNLPSVKKLTKALDLIPTNDVELVVNSNNLEYKGTKLKFKYHLYDQGILTPPRLTLTKIQNLTYDHEFEVDKAFLTGLLKNSSIFKDTNKLYIYVEDGHLVWSLADRMMPNTDALTVIGEDVDFDLTDDFIINLDNLRLLSFGQKPTFTFRINNIGVGSIQLTNGNVNLNYILTSLKK
jgi:hypothetical protein